MILRATPFPRLIGFLMAAVTLFVALALPIGYFGMSYRAIDSAVLIKSEMKAETMQRLINTSPEMWRFEEHRMEEMLTRHPVPLAGEVARVRDLQGLVLVEVGAPAALPLVVRATPVFDAGVEVGRVEIERSLRVLLLKTGGVFLLSLLFATGLYWVLRILEQRVRIGVDRLFREKERAQVTLDSIGDAVITVDAERCIDYLNPIAEKLTGWSRSETTGRALEEVLQLIDEATLEPVENPLERAMREDKISALDVQAALVRRDGTTIAIDQKASPIHDRAGSIVGGVIVFGDVSSARSMARRITWAATHDALTGLVNRREFERRLEAAMLDVRSSENTHALCYLDLDQFKVVNDTCGHAAGDALLKQIGALLQAKVREADTLARLGGDEFGVLLDSCPRERAQMIAADLVAVAREFRFSWDDKVFTVGVSIGLVEITANSGSAAEIFSAADAACYAAKEQGRNRVCTFHHANPDLAERRREMDWATRLTRALEDHRFTLYYQPYLPLGPGGSVGTYIELLLRLVEEDGRLILPGSFIPAAERFNLMPEIDRWVIRTAFSRYHQLAAEMAPPLVCAINLSGTSLNAEGLADFIREQAREYDLPTGAVCFELTETAAINHLGRTAAFIREMRELGFHFALDDFGTGSSSFGYLKNLSVDYLKIDGSFVEDIADDPLDRAMAETINRIGHIMGLKTVGEYAQTPAVIEQLETIGVDFAQGFAHAEPRPLPAAPRMRARRTLHPNRSAVGAAPTTP